MIWPSSNRHRLFRHSSQYLSLLQEDCKEDKEENMLIDRGNSREYTVVNYLTMRLFGWMVRTYPTKRVFGVILLNVTLSICPSRFICPRPERKRGKW